MIETAQRQRLESRTLAVMDRAVDRGDAALSSAVDTTIEYLRDPGADAAAAAAMVAALEKSAGLATRGVNVSVTMPAPSAPTTAPEAAPVQAASASGLGVWWSGLSTVQRAGVGLGVVVAGVWLASKLTKRKRGR